VNVSYLFVISLSNRPFISLDRTSRSC